MHKKIRLLNIVFMAAVLVCATSIAIAVGAGFTTQNGEPLPVDHEAAKTLDCSGPNGIFCEDFESGNLLGWSDFTNGPCQVSNVALPTPVVMP